MPLVLLVAGGSALGGAARYLLGNWIRHISGEGFPYWTLAVNVLGSFLIMLVASVSEDERMRAFVMIGILGGFTTFSSFSMESLKLMMNEQLLLALSNVLLSVVLCLVAAYLGLLSGRALI